MLVTLALLGAPSAGRAQVLDAPAAAAPAPEAGQSAAPATDPGGLADCSKEQFETAVDDAAAALRELNAKNKPELQDKLRLLKDKRGWTQDQFLKEAAPFVKDPEIEVFDTRSNALLAEISAMGEAGSAASTPDCAVLGELNGHMNALVEAQQAKWAYIFGKLAAELAR